MEQDTAHRIVPTRSPIQSPTRGMTSGMTLRGAVIMTNPRMTPTSVQARRIHMVLLFSATQRKTGPSFVPRAKQESDGCGKSSGSWLSENGWKPIIWLLPIMIRRRAIRFSIKNRNLFS